MKGSVGTRGFGRSPAWGPESVVNIGGRSSHSYKQGAQSCCESQERLALTSHAPVDGVHAVIMEEVCAGCLQGRQSQGWPEQAHSCLPEALPHLPYMAPGWMGHGPAQSSLGLKSG